MKGTGFPPAHHDALQGRQDRKWRGCSSPLASLHPLPYTPAMSKKRILTGDTPTGKLHLGHYVGSLENRVALQPDNECFFLIANKHAFTTRAERPDEIRQSVLDIVVDYLAAGIDPEKS